MFRIHGYLEGPGLDVTGQGRRTMRPGALPGIPDGTSRKGIGESACGFGYWDRRRGADTRSGIARALSATRCGTIPALPVPELSHRLP